MGPIEEVSCFLKAEYCCRCKGFKGLGFGLDSVLHTNAKPSEPSKSSTPQNPENPTPKAQILKPKPKARLWVSLVTL